MSGELASRPAVREPSMRSADYANRPQPGRAARIMGRLEPIVLIALPLFMGLFAFVRVPSSMLITTIAAIVALIPFFAHFELSHLRARDLMPIVVMSALAVAGRLIFAPIPAIKPVMAFVIITGICFGRESGFITGALSVLVSNIFFGQGPWTPWQMCCFGLGGYLAGVFADHGWLRKRWQILVFGFLATYLYGFILDTWTLVGFVEQITPATIATTYLGGVTYTFFHASGTVAFLLPLAAGWPKMFNRIKVKYGIGTGSVAGFEEENGVESDKVLPAPPAEELAGAEAGGEAR